MRWSTVPMPEAPEERHLEGGGGTSSDGRWAVGTLERRAIDLHGMGFVDRGRCPGIERTGTVLDVDASSPRMLGRGDRRDQ